MFDTRKDRHAALTDRMSRKVNAMIEYEEKILDGVEHIPQVREQILKFYESRKNTAQPQWMRDYEKSGSLEGIGVTAARMVVRLPEDFVRLDIISEEDAAKMTALRWAVVTECYLIIKKWLHSRYNGFATPDRMDDYVEMVQEKLYVEIGTYNPRWNISTWVTQRMRKYIIRLHYQTDLPISYGSGGDSVIAQAKRHSYFDVDGGDTKGKDGEETTYRIDQAIAGNWKTQEIEDANSIEAKYDIDIELLYLLIYSGILQSRHVGIMELRWFSDETLDNVGHAYGVTRERIRQIEGKAISRIKWVFEKYKKYHKKPNVRFKMASMIGDNKERLRKLRVEFPENPTGAFIFAVTSKLGITYCDKHLSDEEINRVRQECRLVLKHRQQCDVVGMYITELRARLGVPNSDMLAAIAAALPNGGHAVRNGEEHNWILRKLCSISSEKNFRYRVNSYAWNGVKIVDENKYPQKTTQRTIKKKGGMDTEKAKKNLRNYYNDREADKIIKEAESLIASKKEEEKTTSKVEPIETIQAKEPQQMNPIKPVETNGLFAKNKDTKRSITRKVTMFEDATGMIHYEVVIEGKKICRLGITEEGELAIDAVPPCNFSIVQDLKEIK